MECDILEAWVSDECSPYFYNTADMRIGSVPSDSKKLEFTVRSKATLPQLRLHFQLTPGATIEPASGSLQDFSGEPVVYTVTSEDGAWKKQYTVSFTNPIMPVVVSDGGDGDDDQCSTNQNIAQTLVIFDVKTAHFLLIITFKVRKYEKKTIISKKMRTFAENYNEKAVLLYAR
jgi:hypothetical protein